MSCTTCKKETCKCTKKSLPVMPPSECNTVNCPDPITCPEIISTECIVNLGGAILCGDDEVVTEGLTLYQAQEAIVTYFCTRLTQAQEDLQAASVIVTEISCGLDVVYETGDNIIEALEKTVDYFCSEVGGINTVINNLATVATTGAYSDLSGVPTALSDFANDLLTADELAAINGASIPTALNPFATIVDIPTLTSELTNDSGFLTSSVNLYNANGTLTGNRTVTGGGFSLKYTGQSAYSVVSPSASVLDTAFTVRNFGDTDDWFIIRGNGRSDFYGDVYARTGNVFLESVKGVAFGGVVKIDLISAIDYVSRGEIGIAYTNHRFDTASLLTTVGAKIAHFANGGNIKWSINKDGVVNHAVMPTYADNASALVGGLVLGDEYKTATGERRIVV